MHPAFHSFTQPFLCDGLDKRQYSEGGGDEELAALRGPRETDRNQLDVRGDRGGGLQDSGWGWGVLGKTYGEWESYILDKLSVWYLGYTQGKDLAGGWISMQLSSQGKQRSDSPRPLPPHITKVTL